MTKYITVIGLEVHAELKTKTSILQLLHCLRQPA